MSGVLKTLAIGSFDGATAILEGCKQVISDWWRYVCNGDGDQECWAYVWEEGLIDRDTARVWGDEVWPPHVSEDCDDEAEAA